MSAKIVELLQSSFEFSTGNNQFYKQFLESCHEQGTFFYRDSTDTVIKIINSSINSSLDREKGLLLLLAFLPQTSIEAFSNNAVSWMAHCNKIIHQEDITDGLALNVLTRLIKFSVKFPEVSKETAKQIVPKFLLDHVKRRTRSQVSVELINCLQACLSEYSGPSVEFRLDILKLLLSTVEAKSEVVRAAARCIPLVARVGGGGKQGISHKTSWQRQQMSLVALLHLLLNMIYENVDCHMDTDLTPSDDLQLTLEPVNEKNILCKTQRLAAQFTSVSQFLQAMLLEEFPVGKLVSPDAILDLIGHAQKPIHTTLGTSREVLAVVSVLPSIQVDALHVLESLILCLRRNLVPWGGLVSYLCTQVIVWTQQHGSDWPYAMDKPYSQTRLAAYCCLFSWLNVVGKACHMETLVEKSLPVMLTDIHSEKPSVKLRVGSKTGKGKKKQQMLVSLEDRSEKISDNVANCHLCKRALLTLSLLIKAAANILKPDTYMNVVKIVVLLVAELPVPYSDPNCLSALYQLLLTLCLDHHPSVAPPLTIALTTFTCGLHHPFPQVKAMCVTALSSLEKIICPTAATLCFSQPPKKQKPLARELSEENDSPKLVIKRQKVDTGEESDSIISIILNDSDDEPINDILLLGAKSTDEKVNIEESDNSVEILDMLPKSKLDDSKDMYAENENKVIIMEDKTQLEVEVNSICDDNNIELVSNEKVVTPNENEVIETNHVEIKCNNKTEDRVTPTEMISVSMKDENVLSNSDDAEVSQMLIDFNDEVVSSNES